MLVAAVAFWATGSDAKKPPKSAPAKRTAKKSTLQDWTFPKEELAVHFDPPAGRARNIFSPLIAGEPSIEGEPDEELMKLPADLADGESDWAYTGMVEVDGKRLALLENGAQHQGGYVREGDTWKKSRIVRISMANLVIAGPDGTERTIFRYNPTQTPKPPPLPDPGFRPLDVNPALRGPIGLDIRRSPVSADSGAGPAGVPLSGGKASESFEAPADRSRATIKKESNSEIPLKDKP